MNHCLDLGAFQDVVTSGLTEDAESIDSSGCASFPFSVLALVLPRVSGAPACTVLVCL